MAIEGNVSLLKPATEETPCICRVNGQDIELHRDQPDHVKEGDDVANGGIESKHGLV